MYPAGSEAGNAQEVVSVCQSLHRVALQCQQDAEGCWYYHQAVVPCLLAMAVQAATQGKQCGSSKRENSSSALGFLVQQRTLLLPPNGKRGHCGPLVRGRAPVLHGMWVTGLCLPLGSASGLHRFPFHPLFAESSHPLVSKALLEEEVLTAMVPVISAATTHLSPE